MANRAVITGIGLLTPLGNSQEEFFANALKGLCRIRPVRKFDASNLPVRIGGEIELQGDELKLSNRRLAEMPDVAKWGVISARRAVADAKINMESEDPFSIDMVLGVAAPSIDVFQAQVIDIQQRGYGAALSQTPILANPAITAIQICSDLGVQGDVVNISTSCSSSAQAIGFAARQIQNGESTCVLTGGVDEAVTPLFLSSFGNGSVLSVRNDEPSHASRPFDRQRDGYVLSDAACILVVEEYERAKRRGVPIYCEISGFGTTHDAASALRVSKDETASARCVQKALQRAGRTPEEIDYYCAHGSSSRYTDIRETHMLKRVFQDHAKKLQISSIKSMMGHALGASGAVQTATSALSIRHGAVPPTINQVESDPECDLDYVPNEARSVEVKSAVIYSLGMGGSNAALVLDAC